MRVPSVRAALFIGAFATATSLMFVAGTAAASPSATSGESFAALTASFRPTLDVDMGEYSSPAMTVDVVLAPNNPGELDQLLANLYNPKSSSYRQWLAKGEFDARFAPSSAQLAAVSEHLQAYGLTIQSSPSPFRVRASGPSSAITAAFGTTLHSYRNAKGTTYFSNAAAVQLPARLVPGVLGVVGLTNTIRVQAHPRLSPLNRRHGTPSCETPYPTVAQLYAQEVEGIGFPYGYGGGPGCNGLTPSQDNSIYNAPDFGPLGQGFGVNLAVFELSAYQHSDIDTWARTFYGPHFTPPLVDITVDGGPLAPICPAGDTCPPDFNGYAGDIEVDADIEMQLAIAPAMRHLYVYNAPNDYTGQTELDEYTRIAEDDIADAISSSWAVCENDVTAGYVQAENIVFRKMAAQGQAMFGAEGDTGAFSCIRSDGTTIVNVLDPPAQPWVTSVGGTSFETFNPGANPDPRYPQGVESVWNVDSLCSNKPDVLGFPGYDWCAAVGAGGGGNSQWWGRPFYQVGPGVTNSHSTYGNGTTACALAAIGTPCREVPDVSANADEFTPYAEYCTGSAATPYSVCATFSGGQIPPGWFGIGGTSLSSPLWSAVIGDRVGFWRQRVGNANPLLYGFFNQDYHYYFHDITGIGQSTNNNGLFPTTPGFDLATGIGTPNIEAIVTGFSF